MTSVVFFFLLNSPPIAEIGMTFFSIFLGGPKSRRITWSFFIYQFFKSGRFLFNFFFSLSKEGGGEKNDSLLPFWGWSLGAGMRKKYGFFFPPFEVGEGCGGLGDGYNT